MTNDQYRKARELKEKQAQLATFLRDYDNITTRDNKECRMRLRIIKSTAECDLPDHIQKTIIDALRKQLDDYNAEFNSL